MCCFAELDKVRYRKWNGVILSIDVDTAIDETWCYVMLREWRALTGWRYWEDYINADDLRKVCP